MTKIPVGETIQYAYRFTFGHLGAIIGLIWLPMILVTVSGFFAGQRYYADAASALAANNFAEMGGAILMMLGYFLLALLLYAMMYVSITELALGTRKGGSIVHFVFGRLEWRMLRALFALIGVLLFPIVIALAAGGLAGALLGHGAGQGPASLGLAAGALLFEGLFLFVALRFLFLLAPIAVVEEGSVLERAWTLSRGNFWRIVAVLLVAVGPIVLVTIFAQLALVGPSGFLPDAGVSQANAVLELRRMNMNMPLAAGLGFFVSPVTLGLLLGAGSFAYRKLTGSIGVENTATPPP